MRTTMVAMLAMATMTMALAAPAAAASFDCAAARSPDEQAVCASPALSLLDTEMGALWFAYSRVPMLMGASGARRDDAASFLDRRRACGSDTACLAALYRARVAALQAGLAAALPPFARCL